MIGINISGAEFGGGIGGTHDSQYHYPTLSELQFYKNHGVDLVRLPFSWERMQSNLGGPLNPTELNLLKGVLANAAALGMDVIIDLHNYGRYNGIPIGAAGGPTAAQFADFWSKLASQVKDYTSLVGYDLMNEPHDMPTADAWKDAAQAAVNAIRLVDVENKIFVEGNAWSSGHLWQVDNNFFIINDPANKIVYEAHQYFDRYNQGAYYNSYDAEGAYPMVGVDRLKPFVDWLNAHGFEGFVGEFGVPSDDPRWQTVLKNTLDYMAANNLSGTAWGGGTWWPSDYSMFMGSPGRTDSAYFDTLETYFSPYVESSGTRTTITVPTTTPTPTTPTTPTTTTPPPTTTSTTSADNLVTGTAAGEQLNGTPGADRMDGREGDDTLMGSGGADTLIGGAGVDTANYGWAGAAVNVDLTRATQLYSDAHGDTLIGIENVSGGGYNDTLFGDAGNNVLSGAGGDDLLQGRGGADRLDGGDGTDTATYVDSAAGVNIDLTRASQTGGDAEGDVLVNVENITGSRFDDVLRGSAVANVLHGGDGSDTLEGGAGADALYGDAGTDTVTYANSAAGVDVDLTRASQLGGDAAGDTLFGIENLIGSAFADKLVGDGVANWITGGNGDDIINGGGGADWLVGGNGKDRFVFDSAANANGDKVTDFNKSLDKLDFSAIDANVNAAGDQAFTFIANRPFSGLAGELRTYQGDGNTYVAGDTNGDGVADFLVTLSGSVTLNSNHFTL